MTSFPSLPRPAHRQQTAGSPCSVVSAGESLGWLQTWLPVWGQRSRHSGQLTSLVTLGSPVLGHQQATDLSSPHFKRPKSPLFLESLTGPGNSLSGAGWVVFHVLWLFSVCFYGVRGNSTSGCKGLTQPRSCSKGFTYVNSFIPMKWVLFLSLVYKLGN